RVGAADGAGDPDAEALPPVPTLGWAQSIADSTGPGGHQWGSAVHATLEAAMNGLEGEALRQAARTALLENDRPVAAGEPLELDALLRLVERVRASDLWARA